MGALGTHSAEVAVIRMLSDNVKYEILKLRSVMFLLGLGPHKGPMDPISNTGKMSPSGTYAGRELLSMLEGIIEVNQFEVDDQVIKTNQLKGIMEMIVSLYELNNSDNLKDDNELLTYHVTDDKDFRHFEPDISQYNALKNGEFTSLTLRIADQNNNIITDGPQVISTVDANRTLVSNVGRAIMKKLAVKFEGNEIMSIDDYDLLMCYRDLWKTKSEKRNAI